MRRTTAIAFAIALGLGWAGHAFAQAEHYGNRPYELNVNAGAHFVDVTDEFEGQGDTDVGLGVRMVLNQPSGWGFGGNFTWVISNADFDGADTDVNTYLYSGEVDYTFASQNRGHFFVGAGVGAATLKVSDVPDEFEDSETNLLAHFGGGYKWFNRTNDASWAIRGDLRDNIIFHGDEEFGFAIDSATTHNIEVSGGISFLIGGG